MPRRRRQQRTQIPREVSVVAANSMPSGVIPTRVAGSTFPLYVVPPVVDTPCRPTSIVVTVGSSSIEAFKIRAISAGQQTFESRAFLTCGNTIDIHCRNTRSADFANAEGVGAQANVAWVIFASSASTGRVEGVAYFSVRGETEKTAARGLSSSPSPASICEVQTR